MLSDPTLQAELDVPDIIGRENILMKPLQRQAADGFSVLETRQANVVSQGWLLECGKPWTVKGIQPVMPTRPSSCRW